MKERGRVDRVNPFLMSFPSLGMDVAQFKHFLILLSDSYLLAALAAAGASAVGVTEGGGGLAGGPGRAGGPPAAAGGAGLAGGAAAAGELLLAVASCCGGRQHGDQPSYVK